MCLHLPGMTAVGEGTAWFFASTSTRPTDPHNEISLESCLLQGHAAYCAL